MITFDEVAEMLDEIAEEIPQEFYHELYGGIILLPETKRHRNDAMNTGSLFTLGEYHNARKGMGGMGRYIAIYYGSFMKLYAHLSPDRLKDRLRHTLIHEFTHHIESLAGEKGLALKDEIRLEEYKRRFIKP